MKPMTQFSRSSRPIPLTSKSNLPPVPSKSYGGIKKQHTTPRGRRAGNSKVEDVEEEVKKEVTKPSGFFNLHPELRNRIYKLLVLRDGVQEINKHKSKKIKEPPILSVSKQIRQEGLALYYQEHIFKYNVFLEGEGFELAVNKMTSIIKNCDALSSGHKLKKIVLHVHGYCSVWDHLKVFIPLVVFLSKYPVSFAIIKHEEEKRELQTASRNEVLLMSLAPGWQRSKDWLEKMIQRAQEARKAPVWTDEELIMVLEEDVVAAESSKAGKAALGTLARKRREDARKEREQKEQLEVRVAEEAFRLSQNNGS